MATGKFNKKQTRNGLFTRPHRLLAQAFSLIVMLSLFMGTNRVKADETPLSEYQVKALFLFNFAKYIDWPTNTFTDDQTPIVIGILGDDKISDNLNKSVKGKSINNREIVIQRIENESDLGKCHILFIAASEKKHLMDILLQTKARPVLTVGETEQFIEQGGIINFIIKEGKVRLEINVDSAAESELQISSKLLSVADVVKGKK